MRLTSKDVQELEDTYMKKFHRKPLPPGGVAEAWYQVIASWSESHGAEIIPERIRTKEELCFNPILSKQYVDALIRVCSDRGAELTTHQRAMFLVTASVKEREEALKEVFGVTV